MAICSSRSSLNWPRKDLKMTCCRCSVIHCKINICCCVKVNLKCTSFCEYNEKICENRDYKFCSLIALTVICLTIKNKMIKSVTYSLTGKFVSASTKNVIVILKGIQRIYSRNISLQGAMRMLLLKRKTNV